MKMHPVDNLVYHWYNYLIFKLDKDTWTDHCLVLSNNPSQCPVKRGSGQAGKFDDCTTKGVSVEQSCPL
jgi:hypothetical protein